MSITTNRNEQVIDLQIGESELSFSVNREAYNKYINSISPKNKVSPSHNFLVGTVQDESKEKLLSVIKEIPGSEVELSSALLEIYTPDLGIVAKKSSA